MNVKNLVQNAVDEVNAAAVQQTEARVKQLVNKIISTDHEITVLQKIVSGYKAELKELQLPVPVTLDL